MATAQTTVKNFVKNDASYRDQLITEYGGNRIDSGGRSL
jgi:hypothetical protein